jgi:hypothetical protein
VDGDVIPPITIARQVWAGLQIAPPFPRGT